jgi:PPP family 3-phenylpropionic acid transporter
MHVAARLAAYYFAFFAHAGAYVSYFSLYLAARGLTPARSPSAWRCHRRRASSRRRCGAGSPTAGASATRGARRAIIVFSAFAMLAGFIALPFQERTSAIALTLLLLSFFSAGAAPLAEAITFSLLQGPHRRVRPDPAVGFDRLHSRGACGGRLDGPHRGGDS